MSAILSFRSSHGLLNIMVTYSIVACLLLLKQLLKFYVKKSSKEISSKLICICALLPHIDVDYVLSVVVYKSFCKPLVVRQQRNMITKVPFGFIKLVKYTCCEIVRLALSKNSRYCLFSKSDVSTSLHVQRVRKHKLFLFVDFFHSR